jgi:hypothetical protein
MQVEVKLECNQYGFWYELWNGDKLVEMDSVIVDDCASADEVQKVAQKYLKRKMA